MKHTIVTFVLSLVLETFALKAQVQQEPSRIFNLGIRAGLATEFSDPADNPLGLYAATRPLFDMSSFNLSIEGQLFTLNGIGVALETGLRQNTSTLSKEQNSIQWEGTVIGEFPRSSLFIKPSLLYNHMLGERWIILGFLGAEWHSSLSPERSSYYENGYLLESLGSYTLLNLGLEIRTWLNQSMGLSLYFNYSHGWEPVARIYGSDNSSPENQYLLGSYTGSGFDFGVKLSLCFSCQD